MTTLSLSQHGANTPVPPGSYMATLTTELRDSNGIGINLKEIDTQVTTPHTLGSLAAGVATLTRVPGTVVDLVITPK
ncbi:hypothetical protein AB0D10_05210 [Kitasatospora sp. NPDC048545]|uniref:hypothetical protein n=1 Tax=Kitasatospora sp. NPDC048545 TaxID=3157208 RepID=UPI0033CC29E7